MACLYTNHKDREFEDAIAYYQNNEDTSKLYDWLKKQETITDRNQIIELLYSVFMIADTFFISGTSRFFSDAFDKCKPGNLFLMPANEICPNVWFEDPNDFKKLFNAFDKTFCFEAEGDSLASVSELFINQEVNKIEGFWKAIGSLQYNSLLANRAGWSQSNLGTNVETWLIKIPNAKDFVQPYCPTIIEKLDFSHIAYSYLNYGMEIEKNILRLFPTKNPEAVGAFKNAAQYYELNMSIPQKDNKNSRLKL